LLQRRTAHGTASALLPAKTKNTARDHSHHDVELRKLLNAIYACAKMDGSRIQKPESASLKKLAVKDNALMMENHMGKEKNSGREIASDVNAEMDVNTVSLDCAESPRMTVMKEVNDSSTFQDHAASVLHTTLQSQPQW
jgi:pyruvoyl-dependent arginine decarboxylase (PvlArgDC)